MQAKNFLRMEHSELNSNKPNFLVQWLMKMEFATLEVLMEESMFGIKSKNLVLFWKLMLVKLPL
jgi:hypothetical protein